MLEQQRKQHSSRIAARFGSATSRLSVPSQNTARPAAAAATDKETAADVGMETEEERSPEKAEGKEAVGESRGRPKGAKNKKQSGMPPPTLLPADSFI